MSGFGGLLSGELRRFTSRRLFRGLAIAILALVLLQLVGAFVQSSDDPNSGLEDARREVQQCERDRARTIAEEQIPPDQFICPSVEEAQSFNDKRFRYADNMRDVFKGFGILALIVGLVAGASFMGAEWNSGSMTILLTWEARRGRVLLAKLLTALIVVSLAVAALLLIVAVLFFPVAVLRGTTEGSTRSFWWSLAGTGLRDVFLGAIGVSVGTSLATFFRSTAGAVGVGFFYGAVVDSILSVWRDGFIREYLLTYNIARLLGEPVPVDDPSQGPFGTMDKILPAPRGVITLTIYAAVLMTAAYLVFRRRDVT